jgi:ribosomal protein L7/L12
VKVPFDRKAQFEQVRKKTTGNIYTAEEKQQHRNTAALLLAQPQGAPVVVARELRARFGVGYTHAKHVVDSVLEEWSKGADPRECMRNRARAIARVRRMLNQACNKTKRVKIREKDGDQTVTKVVERPNPDHAAAARYETLLMRLEGTDQPIKVDFNVRMNEAVIESISQLTAEQVSELIEEQREVERLAGLARKRLPECIDVEAESVQ